MNKEVKERFARNKENMDFYNQDGTKTESRPRRKHFGNKKKRPPQKIKPISYTYTSDEDAFFDVLDRMCNSCHIISTFINNAMDEYHKKNNVSKDMDIILTSDDYFEAIAQYAVESSMPRLLDKKFIHTMVSVSANKVYIRTEGNVAFSIELKYEIVEKQANVVSCTGAVTLFAKNDPLVRDLEENGFTLIEK